MRIAMLSMFFSSLLPYFLHAQTPSITGKVTDADGSPLKNITVIVKGSQQGVATGEDGTYRLPLAKASGNVLVFSSVGYTSKEVPQGEQTTVDVQLEKSDQSLDAVVVIGYGTQKKRDVTGAVASVPKERLQQLPNTNIAQALQGSVPGLQINTNSSSAEGNDVSILIRGRNSISASNSPLIIWDGIPYAGGISEINMNDIESIEVLKDASAAAIYGSRGSNGVILITSKKGKKGKLAVLYDGFYGAQWLANKPDLLSGPEFYQFKTTRLNAPNTVSPAEQAIYDAGKWVDWYDLATRTGTRSQHSLSVRGGSEKASFYLGATYLNVQGVAGNDQFKRYSLRPTLDIQLAPWLSFGSSTQISFQDRAGLPVEFTDSRNTGGGANFFNPLTNPYDSAGNLAIYAYEDNTQARNPLANVLVKNEDNAYRVFTANNLTVDIPFIKGLSYKLNTGFEYGNNIRKTYYGRNVALGYEKSGDAINFNSINRNFTVENILNYSRSFGKHSVNVTALYSSQSEDYDSEEIEGVGFPNDVLTNFQMNSASLITVSPRTPTTNYKQNLISQMGRINYGYDSRYLLTLTARRDGYSAFGEGRKYGVFPSAAVAWNISEESFMKGISFINNLKLRGSYGLNGNQAVSSYSSLATLSTASYISGGIVYPGYVPSKLANEELGWESTKSWTVGLDFTIWKNRIQGTVDYYSARTQDLLLNRIISSVQGFTRILQNIGKTANQGVEIGLTTTNYQTKNFSWTSNLNFSHNKNKIVDLYGDGRDDVANSWFIGKPIRIVYALQYDGIFRSKEEVAASAQPTAEPGQVRIRDADGDGAVNTGADRTILGQLDPKYIWGFTNTFKFKGLSLMVFFHGVQGVIKDNPLQDDNVFADTRRNTVKKDWWSPTNPNGTHYANDANANKLGVNFYENSSFARLKDVSLAYQFPSSILNRLKISSLKVYVTGRNLATFTKYTGLDPELSNQNGVPLQKEIIGGITLGL
jgi:TonB-linked SusC/RagA family outer membrane protein